MGAPLLIFLLTLSAATIVALVRRRHLLSSVITGVFAAGIALTVLYVPLNTVISILGTSFRINSEWGILGRSFVLSEANRSAIGYLYFTGGFLLTGSWVARPIRMFLPLGLGILSLVAGSLMIVPFLFAAIFIEIAAITALIMLSSRKQSAYSGGIRILIFYTFGMMALLISGWAVDVGGVLSDASAVSERSLLLLYFGFSVLLAIPPFHSWIPIASEEAQPFAIGFTVLILQGAGLFFFLRFMNTFPWIWAEEVNLSILRIGGAVLAIVGALWALTQNNISKLVSYAMVSDVGVMLIAVGFGSVDGFRIALGLLAARVIGISCWAIGMSINERQISHREEMHDGQEERRHWLPDTVTIIGILSLAGVPLTAGFPSRWSLMHLAAQKGIWLSFSILLSSGIIGYAGIKRTVGLRHRHSEHLGGDLGLAERAFLWGGLGITIILGIFPQVLFPWITQTITGLSKALP
jgi:formate hydrogenlyase subunit 3/multisubunit Na+/H+ antiporter MnhD subunit